MILFIFCIVKCRKLKVVFWECVGEVENMLEYVGVFFRNVFVYWYILRFKIDFKLKLISVL